MDPGIAHFNHAGMSTTPTSVLATVADHLELEERIGGYEAAVVAAEAIAEVPGHLARLIGSTPDEVCATESATRAWEQVLWPLAEAQRFGSGDRVVIDQFAYATVFTGLMRLARAHGIEVVVAPSRPDGSVDPDALMALVDERTRMVVITHMPTHVGTVTDVADVGRRLAAAGVTNAGVTNAGGTSGLVFVVDISQTLGQLPIDVKRIGCDVAFAPGRKFLRAPRSTGVLYVTSSLAEQLVPLAAPFGSVDPTRPGEFDLPPGLRRFELFEFAVAARLGLGEAARLAVEIGVDRISAEVAERSRRVIALLDAVPAVERTGSDADIGIISFVHHDIDAFGVQAQLLRRHINTWVNTAGGAPIDASVRAGLPSVRISPHHVTTDDDLDQLAAGLAALS